MEGYSEALKNVTFEGVAVNDDENKDSNTVKQQLLTTGFTIAELMNSAMSDVKPISPFFQRSGLTLDEKIDRVIRMR